MQVVMRSHNVATNNKKLKGADNKNTNTCIEQPEKCAFFAGPAHTRSKRWGVAVVSD